MNQFTEQDQQIAESVLCKICKNPFEDPIQLPCSENICICNSHLNDFIIVDQENQKSDFDCCFCNQKHPLVKGFEFIKNKNLGVICNIHKYDGYSDLYNECKQLLKKPIDFDKTFQAKQENDLSEYFADLRSKIDLKREEMILEIHNASAELLKEINEIENDYLNKLKRLHSDLDLEELKVKLRNYDDELNKYKIDLNEWAEINVNMKQDLSKLDQVRKYSNRLVSSKNEIQFEERLKDNKHLKYLYGKIEKNLILYGRLISGSNDKSIKIWDLESGKCIKSIDAHTISVCCLELLDDNKFASGSSLDKTIKIWDLETFECLKTLNGHSYGVFCLKKINRNKLMSGSDDSTFKIWDINSGNCIKTLQGHTGIVMGLEITNDKKTIISCSHDKTIKIWNYENGECLRTLIGHSDGLNCLTLTKNKIISGSYKEIKIWNIESGKCLKTLIGHNDWVSCIRPFKENQFISGSRDGDIKLWDIESGICLKNIKAYDGCIWALQLFEDEKLFSCSDDKPIKIWNMESGECLKTLTCFSDPVYCFILNC